MKTCPSSNPQNIAIKDFGKRVKEKRGLWIMVNGKWQRIDTDLELAKAVLVNMKKAERK